MPKESQLYAIEEFFIDEKPYYLSTGNEIEVFQAAAKHKIPFAAIGPTGCGKTRFINYMSYLINQKTNNKKPLFFMTCHQDLTATDLLGRDRINGEYLPGLMQRWAETGGILYLDEIVEARPDLATILHPIMEPTRRVFYNERTGKVVKLDPRCILALSWNPGYQDITRKLKVSTRQRLITYTFDYPEAEKEEEILIKESGIDKKIAKALVQLGIRIRGLKQGNYHLLREGASTRLLINTGVLIKEGVDPSVACENAIINCLTDEKDDVHQKLDEVLTEIIENFFPK